MRKVHEKSIILGIGIGMIITSIAGMIYSGGVKKDIKAEDLSKDEVIRLAKSYGMIEKVQLIESDVTPPNTQKQQTTSESTKVASDSAKGASDTSKAASDTAKDASDTSKAASDTAKDASDTSKAASDTTIVASDSPKVTGEKTANKGNKNTTSEKTAIPITAAAQTTNEDDKRTITIEVKRGYNLNKVTAVLFENGIISSKEDFVAVAKSYNAAKKIRVGKYLFKKNDDYKYVVKTICKMK